MLGRPRSPRLSSEEVNLGDIDDKLKRIGQFLRYIRPLALINPRYAAAQTNHATLNRPTPVVLFRSARSRAKVHHV